MQLLSNKFGLMWFSSLKTSAFLLAGLESQVTGTSGQEVFLMNNVKNELN